MLLRESKLKATNRLNNALSFYLSSVIVENCGEQVFNSVVCYFQHLNKMNELINITVEGKQIRFAI